MPLSLNTHSQSFVSHAGGTSSVTGELAPRTRPGTVDAFERGAGRRASNPLGALARPHRLSFG